MAAADLIGTTLAERYRIVDVIGVGGMGTVYAAEHLKLGRRVAVKMLRDEYKGDAGLRARFTAEARTMAEIGHDHIVSVLDIGTAPNGSLYFVMEYLSGEDLADTLAREKRLTWQRVRVIGLQLCVALAACHARKIIHRDLKPPNCFMVARVDDSDYVKILDFGIAKMLASGSQRVTDPHGMHRVDSRRWQHTITGEVFGTMAYMSPEHFFGEEVDHRTDIYALGVILYEMLTGSTPLAADNIGNFAEELRYLDPRPPSERAPGAGIPADVDYLVLRALAKKPEDRFQSMQELGKALAEAREDAPVRPLRPPVTGGDSGSTTMVWSRPEAQAALAGMLANGRAGWRARVGWIAAALVIAAGVSLWWGWPRVDPMAEDEEPRVMAPAIPALAREPERPAPPIGLVAPARGEAAIDAAKATPAGPVQERAPLEGTAAPAGGAREVSTAPGDGGRKETAAAEEEAAAEGAPEAKPARPQEPRCPLVTDAEWNKIFAPVAAGIEDCKIREAVKTTIAVALEVQVGGGQVSARTLPGQSGKVLAAARCIRKHVAGRVKLPAKLQGCRLTANRFF